MYIQAASTVRLEDFAKACVTNRQLISWLFQPQAIPEIAAHGSAHGLNLILRFFWTDQSVTLNVAYTQERLCTRRIHVLRVTDLFRMIWSCELARNRRPHHLLEM